MNYANKTIQYKPYAKINGKLQFIEDTTELEMPAIEYKSDTLSGSGILGEIDLPSLYNIASMTFKISAKIDSATLDHLNAPRTQEYEVRWGVDLFNSSNISVGIQSHKAVIKCLPKKKDSGKVAAGNAMDSSIENEVIYYKKIVDGKVTMEIDKLNCKLVINGTDYTSKLRSIL